MTQLVPQGGRLNGFTEINPDEYKLYLYLNRKLFV